jgi:hypothetical protein
MRSWMSGRGFQVHRFYAMTATLARAGHSHPLAPSRRIIPHDSSNRALARWRPHSLSLRVCKCQPQSMLSRVRMELHPVA